MKKILGILFIFSLLCGCGQTEVPPQTVKETWTEQYSGIVTVQNLFNGQENIITDKEDIRILSDFLLVDLSNTGIFAACENDCKMIVNGRVCGYHSDCGTFNMKEGSFSVDESTRLMLNELLAKYITLGDVESAEVNQ